MGGWAIPIELQPPEQDFLHSSLEFAVFDRQYLKDKSATLIYDLLNLNFSQPWNPSHACIYANISALDDRAILLHPTFMFGKK